MMGKRIVCMKYVFWMPIGAAVLSASQGWTSSSFRVCRKPCATSRRPISPTTDLSPLTTTIDCRLLLSRKAGAFDSLVCTAIVLPSVHRVTRSIVAACCQGPLVPLLPPLARLCILRDDRAHRGGNRCHSKSWSKSPTHD